MDEGRSVSTLIRDLTLRASAKGPFSPSVGDKALMRDAVLLLHELNMGRLLRLSELSELKLQLDAAVEGTRVEPTLDPPPPKTPPRTPHQPFTGGYQPTGSGERPKPPTTGSGVKPAPPSVKGD